MDFSGISSSYLDQYKNMASSASSLEGNLKTNYEDATDEELMDACKKFEAYFLEQVFKEMMKTTKLTEDSSSDTLVDFFKDKTLQQVAADSTETNSLGLAQSLYEQMKRNYQTVSPDSVQPS